MRTRACSAALLLLLVTTVLLGPATSAGAAVPTPAGTTAVITVKTGGDRLNNTTVAPLPGVVLALYADNNGTPGTRRTDSWATCTSDAGGDCSFVVPDTELGGTNRDLRFWVEQVSAPAGWIANAGLVTGPGNPRTTHAYRFRTADQLRAGTVYASVGANARFMLDAGNTNENASGGIWQTSRQDPPLPPTCGLNVALILDVSNSVAAALPDLKSAARTFVDSLVGTPSQVALFTFATTAPAAGPNNITRALTPVSTAEGAATVDTDINGLTLPGGTSGGTNWDRGFFQVAQSREVYDVAIVITDGDPTYYGPTAAGPGNLTRYREVESGIFAANAVQAKGVRMVAVGVGDGAAGEPANLQAVSGPVANSDYYQTPDYASAGRALAAIAQGACRGSVSVVKQVLPFDGTDTSGGVPAGGWTMSASTTTPASVSPATQVTSPTTGAVSFEAAFGTGQTTAPVTITETQQAGYSLVPVNGANAACTRTDTGASVPVSDNGPLGFTVAAAAIYPVSCVVYNRAPVPSAQLRVSDTWVIDGVTYSEGSQPPGFTAALGLDGSPQGWDVPRTGLSQGQQVSVDASTTIGPRQCVLQSRSVSEVNGSTTNADLPYTATLSAGTNRLQIRNVVTCQTRLTLVDTVLFGTADPTDWTLTATAPTGALPGPAGTTGSTGTTATITPFVPYTLAETSGDPNYVQLATANAVAAPGATASWFCEQVDGDGSVVPGYTGGLNGLVTVPIGIFVRCTARNETADLRLSATVVNANGGTATPADFALTATPTSTGPAGPTASTVAGRTDGTVVEVRPTSTYDLSYSGPANYVLVSVVCRLEAGTPQPTTSVILAPEDSDSCVYTFADQAPAPPASPTVPPPTASPVTPPPTAINPSSAALPVTGFAIAGPLTWAVALLTVGGLLLAVGTRRGRSPSGR